MSIFLGDRWTLVVFHLYKVLDFMPDAAAMSLTLFGDKETAISNNNSISANVISSIKNHLLNEKVMRLVMNSVFFFRVLKQLLV